MATLMLVDGNRGESISKAIARRIREELARVDLSVSEVARRLGTTQQRLSRRMTGSTEWEITDLDEFCRRAGISFVYVTTGIREIVSHNPGPDGGAAVAPKTTG